MNLNSLRDLSKDDILDSVGLQTKSSPMPGILGAFGVGMLVGAGIALLLAPKAGNELRDDLREKLRRAPKEVEEMRENIKESIKDSVKDAVASVNSKDSASTTASRY
jgi:gas vesicle protein